MTGNDTNMNIKSENKFTLESALAAKQNNTLKLWVQNFLRDEGKNTKLADVLKANKKVWADLVEYDLLKLVRVMGPEKEMVFQEDQKKWEHRINTFTDLIKDGYKPAPLIVTDIWGDLHISDGTHRFEALKKAEIKKYWTIFYLKNPNNIRIILDSIKNTLL
jgi:hypothetical protein